MNGEENLQSSLDETVCRISNDGKDCNKLTKICSTISNYITLIDLIVKVS